MNDLNPVAAHLMSKPLRAGDLVLVRADKDPTPQTVEREAAAQCIEGRTGARCLPVMFDEHGCAVIWKPELRRLGIFVAPRGDGLVPHHEIPGLVLRVPSAQPVLPPKIIECAGHGTTIGSPFLMVGAVVALALGVMLQRSGLLWWL